MGEDQQIKLIQGGLNIFFLIFILKYLGTVAMGERFLFNFFNSVIAIDERFPLNSRFPLF